MGAPLPDITAREFLLDSSPLSIDISVSSADANRMA